MGKLLVIKGADFSSVAVAQVTPIANMVSITVVASPSGGGTVSGGGSYAEGTSVQISAVAKTGYAFSQWSDGNTNATRTIIANSSTTYTAEFTSVPIGSIMSTLTDHLYAGALGKNIPDAAYEYNPSSTTRNCIYGVDLSAYVGRHIRIKAKSEYVSIFALANSGTPANVTGSVGYAAGTDQQKDPSTPWTWNTYGTEVIATITSEYTFLLMNIALRTTPDGSDMPTGATAETYFDAAEID